MSNATESPPWLGDHATLMAEFVAEATAHLDQAEHDLLVLERHPADSEAIDAVFRGFHTIKGVAGFLDLQPVQLLAHATETLLDRGRRDELRLAGSAFDRVLASLDLMKQLVADIDRDGGLRVPRPDVVEQAARCSEYADVRGPSESPAIGERRQCDRRRRAGNTVRVDVAQLDKLAALVGELAETQGCDDVIVRELQTLSRSLRSVPVGTMFGKMLRVVRDTARRVNKDVELITAGGDLEIDRTGAEPLADSLMHMIRNTVDHGIESPDVRRAAGKPIVGTVTLSACCDAGGIRIDIGDDGRGLSADLIKAAAVTAGVVSQVQADAMPDDEAFRLIFTAGLSTADAITEVSGRGVGMDVARRNVEGLHGRIGIASTSGSGSLFTIHLPRTSASSSPGR